VTRQIFNYPERSMDTISDMGIRESCCYGGNGTRRFQSQRVLCLSRRRVLGQFFTERSVTGQLYLQMLQNWLLPQPAEEEFIFLPGGAPVSGSAHQVYGLFVHQPQKTLSEHGYRGHRTIQSVFSSRTLLTPLQVPKALPNCEEAWRV
jgi:hypothetical protein